MENAALLEALEARIAVCKSCSLYKNATNAVPGEGNPNAKIFFIGEGPGFYEDQTGRPFVGRAGQLLEKTLSQIGLSRSEVFIGNVVKHRPPENRDPMPSEIAACAQWLDQQLSIIRPKIVVTLGRFSLAKFLPGAKISLVHGVPKAVKNYSVIPMYHPAAALRSDGLLAQFTEDFVKNKDLLLNPDSEIEADDDPGQDPNQASLF
jgi:DNA polymerase